MKIGLTAHIAVGAVLLCLSAGFARAEFTGNTLYDACRAPRETPADALCMGYIIGSLGMIRAIDHFGPVMGTKLRFICEPPEVTGPQLIEMARDYLAAHPEKRAIQAAALLLDLYTTAFPCPKRSN